MAHVIPSTYHFQHPHREVGLGSVANFMYSIGMCGHVRSINSANNGLTKPYYEHAGLGWAELN